MKKQKNNDIKNLKIFAAAAVIAISSVSAISVTKEPTEKFSIVDAKINVIYDEQGNRTVIKTVPEGYTMQEVPTIKTVQAVERIITLPNEEPKKDYYAPSGYQLVGDKAFKVTTKTIEVKKVK